MSDNDTDIVWDKEATLGLLILLVFALAIVGGFYAMCGESTEERDARLESEAESARVAAEASNAPDEPTAPAAQASSDAPDEPTAPAAQASEVADRRAGADDRDRIAGDHKFGCRDREYHSKLTRIVAQRDREAFVRGLVEGVLSGECVVFDAGEQVFVTDVTWSGLVKVRRKGGLDEYWTQLESLER